MSEDAIRAEVQAVLTVLGISEPSAKDKGKVMKELMPKVKGKADGSLVNRIVGEILDVYKRQRLHSSTGVTHMENRNLAGFIR